MDKISSVLGAINAGKLPSTEQLNAFIDWIMQSVIPALQPTEGSLSEQGRVVADDIRNILQSYKSLNSNKNADNLLQEAIWHLTEGDVNVNVAATTDSSGSPSLSNGKQTSSDVDAVRSSLHTLLSVIWQSLCSEGDFLFNDFASFTRLALADAAEVVQDQAGRTKDSLRDIEHEVQEGTRDSLGRDKQRLEEEKDARVMFEHRMDTVKDTGSSAIGASQSMRGKFEGASGRPAGHMEDAYYRACKRAQQDPSYHSAVSILFDTLHKWVSRAFDTPPDQPFTLETLIEDSSPEKHIEKAIDALKSFLNRFTEPRISVDTVIDKGQRFVAVLRGDSVQAKPFVDAFFEHARRSLDEAEYPNTEEAIVVQEDLRQQWHRLLDTDSDTGRSWAELKEATQSFGTAFSADEDICRLRDAHAQLGENAARGLLEAGGEAQTGMQAMLERATWFWHDIFAVYVPRMLSMLKEVPIPRTEFVDEDMELVLEDFDISSLAIDPAHISIRNTTELDIKTAKDTQNTTNVGTTTHIRMQAVQLTLADVSFYYNDQPDAADQGGSRKGLKKLLFFGKKASKPSELTGILTMKLPPQGLDIDVKIQFISSEKQRAAKHAYYSVEQLAVHVSDNMELNVHKSNRPVSLTLFKPMFKTRFREVLERALSEQVRVMLEWIDGVAWDVGRRAEVFADTGMGRGAAITAAMWSEIGRLRRERIADLWLTGTGFIIEESGEGKTKLAMGMEPQVLSGEKHGPAGTGSQSLEQRVGQTDQTDTGREGAGTAVSRGEMQNVKQTVKSQAQGLVDQGKGLQRSVDEKSAMEKKRPGWQSEAFNM